MIFRFAKDHAESKDPVLAGTCTGVEDRIHGENSSTCQRWRTQNTRSFDSGNQFASELIPSAQDDSSGVLTSSCGTLPVQNSCQVEASSGRLSPLPKSRA